jgi:superfamily II DNA/RNA helicase
MYNKTNSRQSRGKQGWKNKSSNKFRGQRSGFGARRSGGGRNGRGGGFQGAKINPKLFINKAQPEQVAEEVFTPQCNFAELEICQPLKRAIAARGFEAPTPIQDQAIPAILAGRDLIGLANTGTGKTGAFLIPLIHRMIVDPKEKTLVVVPTRELAIQIQEEFRALTKGLRLSAAVIVGGANIHRQMKDLRNRPNMVVGTPGRLKDLISRKQLVLTDFSRVVLDEADRMLDMGFVNEVKWLMSLMAQKRQTLLFSATFSPEIERLVENFLDNPVRISLRTKETSTQIQQDVVKVMGGQDKVEILHGLLIKDSFEKVLVFTRTKRGADKLSKSLYQKGLKSEAIHGDKPHNRRQKALQRFRSKLVNVLIATDVAARGLDIPDVSHVINFDVPNTYEDYIHRIGRTGRANKQGAALTFVG